ncbi:CheC domain-containing protein [Clostridium aceticum]|uniref:CheC domain-containing protein n=1 Tax=Clostridium aceticum TaxID=84022 RepID=A0A0D8IBH2_9CLOT|nr:chemotaxis protein CheX [Clostridium aceticum]AKL96912.1 CheC domain-containing protein [Clostridium aceticum]KJF27643.1 chemotaxis protein CheC [Clostridium aceticum]
MKAEYINQFIEASTNVIHQTTGLAPKLGKVGVKDTPYKSDNVLVLIGLTGKISGNVVINFSKEMAYRVASAMMMGMPVTELDEMGRSAIGELCNMIMGNTATLFSQKGVDIDITPPTILTGERIQLSIHKSVIMCVPLLFEDGDTIEVDISYVDK